MEIELRHWNNPKWIYTDSGISKRNQFFEIDKHIKMKEIIICILWGVIPLLTVAQPATSKDFEIDINFFKVPEDLKLLEVSGVALNSKGNIFLFPRGQEPLIEFNSKGEFIRSICSSVFVRGHCLKIDRYDNIWTVDRGAHVVLKVNQEGKVLMVLGR